MAPLASKSPAAAQAGGTTTDDTASTPSSASPTASPTAAAEREEKGNNHGEGNGDISRSKSRSRRNSKEEEAARRTRTRAPRQTTDADSDDDDSASGPDEEAGNALKDDPDHSQLPFSKARCIALVAILTGSAFVNTVALQSVVIILPTIGRDLHVSESSQQWIVSSYSLTFGCFLLFWGRVADLYGKRLIFLLGSAWVTVITAASPFMPNGVSFILFRALHGLGAAANVPTALGILGSTFPPSKAKNYAFSTYGAGAPLGSVFGNILSGFIAQYTSWKWVFGVVALLELVITVAAFFVIPPPPPPPPSAVTRNENKSIDWTGAVLVTTGLIALMFALTEGNVVGWNVPWIPVLIVVSVLILATFVAWQWYLERRLAMAKTAEMQEETMPGVVESTPPSGSRPRPLPSSSLTPPLIKVSIFRNLRFSAVMLIMALFFGAFSNYLIYSTYFFQDYQGLDPIQAMLRFLPTGVGGAIVATIVSQLISRVPTLFLLTTGNVAISVACLLYALPIPPSTTYWAWGFPAMILSVVGADTTWPSLTLFTSKSLPREDQAVGGALVNAVGQFGRSISLAVSTAIQTSVMADARHVPIKNAGSMIVGDPATLNGLRAAAWTNFGFGAASLVLVLMAFQSMEIVGKTPPPTEKPGGDEAMINAHDHDDETNHHDGNEKRKGI